MKRLVLVLSAACLALVAVVAARAILSDTGGAESAGPVPSAVTVPNAVRPERCGETSVGRGDQATDWANAIWRKAPRGAPKVDYVVDLNSGATRPLPDSIIRSLGNWEDTGLYPLSREEGRYPSGASRYAASRDGSRLAFVGVGEEGSLQIFIAGIDGTGVRQLTHDPKGAINPAWSPDASMIAYNGSGAEESAALFVLEVATGESTPLPEAGFVKSESEVQFTHDGSALLYTGRGGLQTVPMDGGKSTVLIGRAEGIQAFNGALSPDGSLVTMMGVGVCGGGPTRFVSNADGTHWAHIPGRWSNPAGTWSPDGRRIVASAPRHGAIVVDVATGRASPASRLGNGAIWLDGHTLLVEVS